LSTAVGVSEPTRQRLVELMDEALFASAAGELLDLDYSGAIAIPTVDNILSMARLKTAVYSFEVPLKAGAVLAGADETVIESMGDFGREIGTAYQIVDDLLGAFRRHGRDRQVPTRAICGRASARCSSRTPPRPNCGPRWAPLFGSPTLSDADADALRAKLESSGAKAYAEALLAQHVDRAREVLDRPQYPRCAAGNSSNPVIDIVLRRGSLTQQKSLRTPRPLHASVRAGPRPSSSGSTRPRSVQPPGSSSHRLRRQIAKHLRARADRRRGRRWGIG
jgi:geranylgeranyl diphosphate synthase type II